MSNITSRSMCNQLSNVTSFSFNVLLKNDQEACLSINTVSIENVALNKLNDFFAFNENSF